MDRGGDDTDDGPFFADSAGGDAAGSEVLSLMGGRGGMEGFGVAS